MPLCGEHNKQAKFPGDIKRPRDRLDDRSQELEFATGERKPAICFKKIALHIDHHKRRASQIWRPVIGPSVNAIHLFHADLAVLAAAGQTSSMPAQPAIGPRLAAP